MGRKGLSHHRWIVGGKRCLLNQWEFIVGWAGATANVADTTLQWLIRQCEEQMGRVTDLHFTVSHGQPKFVTVDQQPNDDVRHLSRAGEAARLAGETLDPSPQRQMFALDLLRVSLARTVLVRIEVTSVRAPVIGVIARDAKRLEQPFELQKYLILPPAKDIGQDLTRMVIDGMPEPPLVLLLPYKGPHLIDFRFLSPLNHYVHIIRMHRVKEWLVH
jgi:hypothetical protein